MGERTRRATGCGPPRRRPARPVRGDGEAALRAALRRWRQAPARREAPPAGNWWPALTPGQVQGLIGAGVALAVALWEHLRGRWER